MRISYAFHCVLAILACLPSVAQSDINYEFHTYNYPNDTFTQFLGINKKGVVAGYHGLTINKGFTFKIKHKRFTSENFPGSVQTQVTAINNEDHTAGFYIDESGINHGFIRNHEYKTVDFPNTSFNQILGRNNKGFAVGYWQDLITSNDFPYIYVEDSGVFLQLGVPGAVSAQATGINDSFAVCGFYIDSSTVNHGFLFNQHGFTTLDFPGATFTQALGLNDHGFVVGTYMDSLGASHGFLYINGSFQSIDDPNGIGTTVVNGINDHNDIVGFYVDSDGNTDGFVGKAVDSDSDSSSD